MRIFYFFVCLLVLSANANALLIESTGQSIIKEGNVEKADKLALENALINGISRYYEDSGKKNIPEITPEFFKFISYYRILDRNLQNYKVKYNIEMNLDEVAIGDLKYFLNHFVHSSVYYVEFQGYNPDNATGTNGKIKEFRKNIVNIFNDFNFTSKYQQEFHIQIPENHSLQEIISIFATSKAKYLFYFKVIPDFTNLENSYLTKTTLLTNIYKKSSKFPEIKSVASSYGDNKLKSFNDAFTKSMKNMLKYVRKNLIKLPKSGIETKTFQLVSKNFGSLAVVQKLMDELKNKNIILNFKTIRYSGNEMQLEIVTKFNKEDLIQKLRLYRSKYKFQPSLQNNYINLDFQKVTQ